jgi:hypothetical protein
MESSDEFVLKVVLDKYLGDMDFVNYKIKQLTKGKSNVKLLAAYSVKLPDFTVERSVDALSMTGNIIFFWDGQESLGDAQIKEARKNSANIRIIRYDDIPLLANVSFLSYFPRKKYTNHNNKPLNNVRHLDNWIDTFDKRGLKVTYLDYKFQDYE